MHEISVARGILERARTAAAEHGADEIETITVEVGRATHVNTDQLVFCLEAIVEGTVATGATIETERIEPAARCDCGWKGTPEDLGLVGGYAPDVRCPHCGARAELHRGRECRLASIEVPPEESVTDGQRATPGTDRPEIDS